MTGTANRPRAAATSAPGRAAVVVGMLAALGLLLAPPPAQAQGVADELAATGYVVEDGADDVDDSRLEDAVGDARNQGVDLSVAFLAEDPEAGAEAEADSLAERVDGVVLVVSPSEIGASSATHSSGQIDSALDAAADELGSSDDPVDAVVAFADELESATAGAGFDTSQLPGPLAGLSVPALIIGAIAVLVVLSLLGRLLGGGRRRGGHQGPMGQPGYGRGYGRRRRGGMGGGFVGGLLGGALGGRMARGGGGQSASRRGSATRGRSSSSRSSSSRSRSSGSRSRSRSSGSRRR